MCSRNQFDLLGVRVSDMSIELAINRLSRLAIRRNAVEMKSRKPKDLPCIDIRRKLPCHGLHRHKLLGRVLDDGYLRPRLFFEDVSVLTRSQPIRTGLEVFPWLRKRYDPLVGKSQNQNR